MNMNMRYFPLLFITFCHLNLLFVVSNPKKMGFIFGQIRYESAVCFDIESQVDAVQILRFHKKTL